MARKRLNSLEKTELVALVKNIMELSDDNKLFVRSSLADAGDIEVEKYKKKISRALSFNLRTMRYWDFKEAKRILRYLEKATDDAMVLADVYVHTVMEGRKITETIGDLEERDYISMEDFYENAIKWALILEKQGHDISRLRDELYQVRLGARDIGWGYSDVLLEIWTEYFGDKNEL
ncbi:hypothetical protein [uncultured Methanolobus sp.]|uniref:hypothetical protein n=1 Tax=uncultured Methanolobus sp. TaxID=218300 RepID=UPI002AAAEE71|nr:hypothetical protein [uncultured Methanolobus sp.]